MTATGQHRIVDERERRRFEIRDGDDVLGYASYERRPGLIAVLHTEVDEAHEGEGLGGELARAALDTARDEGMAVLPLCPFVNAYIKRHREYADLVPEELRANFGL